MPNLASNPLVGVVLQLELPPALVLFPLVFKDCLSSS